jgi:hypothetical protein
LFYCEKYGRLKEQHKLPQPINGRSPKPPPSRVHLRRRPQASLLEAALSVSGQGRPIKTGLAFRTASIKLVLAV